MRMNTIEYIGAAPRKPKKSTPLGGWIMVALALGVALFFLRPIFTYALAQQDLTSDANLASAVATLQNEDTFSASLAAAALKRTEQNIVYDPTYYQISFPGGDIPANKGTCTEVLIRSYRSLGIDLQKEVNEDMSRSFRQYPQLWNLRGPDTNIDHRRVPNLQRFFSRKGESLPLSSSPSDYRSGDLVAWRLLDGATHIGIVVPGPGSKSSEPWIVHNIGSGPKWEDGLFSYDIIGHYRYSPPTAPVAAVE